MYHKVRIKKLPNKAVGGGINGNRIVNNQLLSWGGADFNMAPKKPKVTSTITGVPRKDANLEAEGGETVYGDINGDGMAEHAVIKGPRHSSGGVPLNLPDDSFIFSDTASMKIKDKDILAKFGKSTGSYTPADLAKQYDLNKYRKLLQDPDSDPVTKKTAELMIRNYTMKLGALAIAQESKKGFPQGIPMVARPYMDANGIKDEDLIPQLAKQGGEQMQAPEEGMQEMAQMEAPQEGQMQFPEQMPNGAPIATPMAAYGMTMGGYDMPFAQDGYMMPPVPNEFAYGGLYRAAEGTATPPYSEKDAYTPQGVIRLNKYRAMYGLPPLKGNVTKADIQKAAGEMQNKIIERNPELVVDYMSQRTHKPNNQLISVMNSKDPKKKYPRTTAGVKQAIADGVLGKDDVKSAYKDNLWWYRALETEKKELSKEEYEKKMKDPNAIKQGETLFFNEDPNNPQLYTEYIMKEGEKAPEVKEEEQPEDVERPEAEVLDIPEQPQVMPAEWMTPDIVNYYGALKDKYSISKDLPLAAKVDLEVPDPLYKDPMGELQQQSGLANITARGLGQFAGPQGYAANMANIQGTGAEQAAATIARYNNENVALANQFAANAANIRNQEQMTNQAATQRLYDQTSVANQQYANAKRQADANVRQAFNTGWSNASNLALTNALYEQYDIDPRTGTVIFKDPKAYTPTSSSSISERAAELHAQGWDQKIAYQMAKDEAGQSSSGVDVDRIMENYAQYGGFLYGDMMYPYGY